MDARLTRPDRDRTPSSARGIGKGFGWLVLAQTLALGALAACLFWLTGERSAWVLIVLLLPANIAIWMFVLRRRRSHPRKETPPQRIPRAWWAFFALTIVGATSLPILITLDRPDLIWVGFGLMGLGLVGRMLVSMSQERTWKGRLYYVAMIIGFSALAAGMFGGIGWAFWLGFAWLIMGFAFTIVLWLAGSRKGKGPTEVDSGLT